MVDRKEQASPEGRGHSVQRRDEDDLVTVEVGREGHPQGRIVEGRQGEVLGGNDTELRRSRLTRTMSKGKKTIRRIEAKK